MNRIKTGITFCILCVIISMPVITTGQDGFAWKNVSAAVASDLFTAGGQPVEKYLPDPGVRSDSVGGIVKYLTEQIKNKWRQSVSAGPSLRPEDIPAYEGTPVAEINDNVPFFKKSDLTNIPSIHLSKQDSRGRCRQAFACLGPETMADGERGSVGMIRPTGWHTVKYDSIEGGYLFHRCHLLMWKASSVLDDSRNLITGTQYMNTQGMMPYEYQLVDLIEKNGFHVLYRVTPVFEGRNLLASGVLMEALSVEDSGEGLRFCIFAYNVQPGIGINYATGESWKDTEENMNGRSSDKDVMEYILNTHSKKFHSPECPSVNKMKSCNRKRVKTSRKRLLARGYTPCGSCNP